MGRFEAVEQVKSQLPFEASQELAEAIVSIFAAVERFGEPIVTGVLFEGNEHYFAAMPAGDEYLEWAHGTFAGVLPNGNLDFPILFFGEEDSRYRASLINMLATAADRASVGLLHLDRY